MSFVELLMISILFAMALMTVAWAVARKIQFYSLVDVIWAYGIGVISVFYALSGTGLVARRVVVAVLAMAWSLRLGTYLWLRLGEKFPKEDLRYLKLKTGWPNDFTEKFFWFFQFQAWIQILLCLPFLMAVNSKAPLFWADYLGLFLSLIGILGEWLSDRQLSCFKRKAAHRGLVCNTGFWRYSRHPNYFFEWVIWCGFSFLGLFTENGFISVLCPLLMFLLLNYVTGVPPAELQSLASKGELYREYQKTTNRFFPWRPRVGPGVRSG